MTVSVPLICERPFRCDLPPKVPSAIKFILDRRFPGWDFIELDDEICQIAHQRSATDGHPFLINGDFNGDRRMDYAVLIQYGWLTNADGKPIQPDTYVVVFLNKGLDFEDDIVSRHASDSLQLMRKGDRDYDYEAQREFVYRNDTIFAGMGMGGTSYLYENGKFRAIITAD